MFLCHVVYECKQVFGTACLIVTLQGRRIRGICLHIVHETFVQ